MKKIIYPILLLFFAVNIMQAQSPVKVVSGKFSSKNKTALLKTFEASQGDILEFKITVHHKRKGLGIWVKQHPGNLIVMNYNDLKTSTKKIVAPADAIYQVYYGGSRVDFSIEINNYTNKPNGPGRGAITYVQIPDTLHASGYVTKPIGESYKLTPYKEKVILKTSKQSEQICSRNFFTGVDLLELNIPGNVKDEYREQKLLSYSVLLTCGELGMQQALFGVVDAGIDHFVKLPDIGGKSKNKGKLKKADSKNQYDFTDNLDKESNKLETFTEIVGITEEAADTLAPGSKGDDLLKNTAFVLDGGVQELVLEKAMDAAGVPKNAQAIIGAVQSFPSVTDLAKDGYKKLLPKVKGSVNILLEAERKVKKSYIKIPMKEFWIQSAMSIGTPGGCWDIGGHPQNFKKGQNIHCWDIDNGKDRLYKFVPSKKYKGYYEIHTAMPGAKQGVVDVAGGTKNLKKNGTNIHLWERHGGKCQVFKIKHFGNGKIKIYNYAGYVVHLDNRKNTNGTNIKIWEDQNGKWMEWYLIDPVTSKPFVPTEKIPYEDIERYTVLNKNGGYINEKIKVNSADEVKKVFVRINKNGFEAKAKLIVEAQYEITDYTDVIRYNRTTEKVNTKDFWTAYKVNYSYAIMFKDQVKDYYKTISKSIYNSSSKPNTEIIKSDDFIAKSRMMRYNLLTKKK